MERYNSSREQGFLMGLIENRQTFLFKHRETGRFIPNKKALLIYFAHYRQDRTNRQVHWLAGRPYIYARGPSDD
jgi:hypothetical protein